MPDATPSPPEPSLSDARPLLDYAITTDPFPLRAAPTPRDLTNSTLFLVVSNGGDVPVKVKHIVFVLPEGTFAQHLIGDKSGLKGNTEDAPGWTVVPLPDGVMAAYPDSEFVTFAPPDKADTITTNGIALRIEGVNVNTQVGTARIEILETASAGDRWPESQRTGYQSLTKYKAKSAITAITNFRLKGETGRVNTNNPFTLTWTAPKTASLTLRWDNEVRPNLTAGEYEVKGGIRRDTTFTLSGTIDRADQFVTTTVGVYNPTLDSLVVKGNVTAQSAATVAGSLTVVSSLTVTGDVTAIATGRIVRIRDLRGPQGGRLTVDSPTDFLADGDVTVAANLTATGGIVRIRDLRGPLSKKLTIDSSVQFQPNCDVLMDGGSEIKIGDVAIRKNDLFILRKLADGELVVEPWNTAHKEYLFAGYNELDGDRRYALTWVPGNRIGNGYWQLKYPRGA